jgi:hypothetical protein
VWQIDDVEENKSELRRQEFVTTILGDTNKPSSPILETVNLQAKSRETDTSTSQSSFDIEPNDIFYLRAEGVNIKKEVTKSSVTGRRNIKTYDTIGQRRKKTGKRDRER